MKLLQMLFILHFKKLKDVLHICVEANERKSRMCVLYEIIITALKSLKWPFSPSPSLKN